MFSSSIGFEAELFLIDSDGKITAKADEVLSLTSNLKRKPVKEYAKEVVEINAHPSEIVEGAILDYIKSFYEIDEEIQKKDLYLLPMASYPVDYVPERRDDIYYKCKEKILGEKSMDMAARFTSFHFHYLIPEKEEKIVQLYNFLISLVPVFDALLQSSPFFKGRHFAKSARGLLYRDFSFEGEEGAYYNNREFGGIPEYKENFYDLLRTIHKRNREWKSLILKNNCDLEKAKYDVRTDYYWGTVRLNPIGTVELRSPDINIPSLLLDGIYLFRSACDFAVENEIKIGDSLYFEDNNLYIPPYEKIRDLSFKACLHGLKDDEVYSYVKKYLSIIKTDGKLSNISKMMEERKNSSDLLLEKALSLGFVEELDEEQGRELSLFFAEKMLKESSDVEKRALSLFSEQSIRKVVDNKLLISKILQYLGEEEKLAIDISRASPSRMKNISAIVISPYVVERTEDMEKLKENLNFLSNIFRVVVLVKREHSPALNSFKDLIEVPEINEDIISTIKGAVRVWAESNNIKINNILYIGVDKKEKELMNYFGASATYTANKDVREFSDILIKDLREIPKFVGNN